MRKVIMHWIVGFIIIVLYIAYHLYVYAGVATTSAEFLILPVGARASALAGAFTAINNDVNAIAYNPAGLANLEYPELMVMHSAWLINTTIEYGAYAFPTKIGTWGIAIAYINYGDMIGRNTLGVKTNDFSASDLASGISYSFSLNEQLYMGIKTNYIQQKIDNESRSGGAIDAGTLWEVVQNKFFIGAAIQNFGPRLEAFDSEEEPLPLIYRLGTGYYFNAKKCLVSADILKLIHTKFAGNLGFEYNCASLFVLRSGMSLDPEKEKTVRLMGGMGFCFGSYALDYCYEPFGDLDSTHRFSVTISF